MKVFTALVLGLAATMCSATTPEGKKWLAENLKKDGVQATDSGLRK